MKLAAGLILALLSTAALSYGFYVQHSASGKLPTLAVRHPLSSLRSLFTNWQWLAGFVLGLGGWGLYIIALRFAPLSLVQATSAGGVGLLALLVRLGGRSLSRSERVAVTISVGALVLLGLSLPAGIAHAHAPTWPAPLGWALASILLAAVAAAPGGAVLRPGAGLAITAGLLYSAGDVATKAAVDGTSPGYLFVGLLLVCHGLGFVSLQLALQRGTALATAGVSTLLTNVLPILAGLTVFSESMPGGAAGILRGLGFAGAILGTTSLAATGHAGSPGPDEQTESLTPSQMPSPATANSSRLAGNSPARADR
ncbi:MAG TPA: hypothetical protein DHU96_20830 [Actinobacteria bacterium]|nr:hypothetical protein [Actinomycetota bacterium]